MRASNLMLTILMLAVAVTAPALDSPEWQMAPPGDQVADTPEPTTTVSQVQVTRDGQGVWYIEGGDTLFEVFEAMGYEVATDRLFQMDLFRRQARGTLSELLGAEFLAMILILANLGLYDQPLGLSLVYSVSC